MLPPSGYMVKRTPANIAKAYENDLPDNKSTSKQSKTRVSQSRNNSKYQQKKPPPFAAKVKRRWSDTKAKVRRHLGLYASIEPMPIGLYLDMVI